ncbi:MAG: nitroreductase family protein [archaeon]
MDALEAIFSRRSIREYSGKEIRESEIETLLRAGMSAPSAHNEQPWQFVLVRERDRLEALSKTGKYSGMVARASAAIVVCGEGASLHLVEDLSCAAENILLASHALGLGSVWVALYPSEDRIARARAALKLPKGILPLCIIPVGYPAEKPAPEERFRKERIHNETW